MDDTGSGANFISGPCGERWDEVLAFCHISNVALRSYPVGGLPSQHSDLFVFVDKMLVGKVKPEQIQHIPEWFIAVVKAALARYERHQAGGGLQSESMQHEIAGVMAAREANGYYKTARKLDATPVIGETADKIMYAQGMP